MSTLNNPDIFEDPQAELRAEYRQAMKAWRQAERDMTERGLSLADGAHLLPVINWSRFMVLRCGAKTKAAGRPCKRKDIFDNGRCRLHGGMSTGPRTAEGKARCAANGGLKGMNGASGGGHLGVAHLDATRRVPMDQE